MCHNKNLHSVNKIFYYNYCKNFIIIIITQKWKNYLFFLIFFNI